MKGNWAVYTKEGDDKPLNKNSAWALYANKGNCKPLAKDGTWATYVGSLRS